MKNRISVIVFDLGNVLLPFDYDILIRKLNVLKHGLGEHFVKSYFNNYEFHRKFESGKLPEKEFISEMLNILGHKVDGETFCRYYSDIFIENEKVTAILPELRKEFKLGMLSNTNSIHHAYGWKNYGFINNFDFLVLSYKAGAVKPEEAIYRQVEKASGCPSSEHIFIDDIKDYVLAAKKIGWDGIHFEGYSSLMNELKIRGII